MEAPSQTQKIFGYLNLFGLFTALAVYTYTHFLFEKPLPNNANQFKLFAQEAKGLREHEPIKLKKLTVNLYSMKTRLRFLDVEVHVLPFKREFEEIIETYRPILLDIIVDITGEMSADELNSVAGKILLENRIKVRFQSITKYPLIKKVFFSTFVIS